MTTGNMNAIFLRDHNQARYALLHGELLEPGHPEPGEVLIRVHAASVAQADLPGVFAPLPDDVELPAVAGREAAGVVEEVGPGVTTFEQGDRVALLTDYGAWAELARVDARCVMKLPEEISFGEGAALLGAVVVAVDAVQIAGLSEGEYVVVTGAASAVGSAIVQVAKIMAHARVIAAVAGATDSVIAEKLAPELVVDREVGNVETALDGSVVRVAFDTAGAAHRLRHIVAKGGRIVQAGEHKPEARIHGERRGMQLDELCRYRKIAATHVHLQATPARVAEAARIIRQHGVRVPHGPRFGVKEYVRGLVAAEEGVASGKVVFLF